MSKEAEKVNEIDEIDEIEEIEKTKPKDDVIKKESIRKAIDVSREKEIKELQTKLSEYEKKSQDTDGILKSLQIEFSRLKGVPSSTNPQKSMFDEIIDAMGWSHVEKLSEFFK